MFHKNEGKMKKLLLSVIALCGVMSVSAQRFPTETVRPWLDETKGGLKEARYFGEWGAWMDESFNVVRDAEKNTVSLEHISEGEVVSKETWSYNSNKQLVRYENSDIIKKYEYDVNGLESKVVTTNIESGVSDSVMYTDGKLTYSIVNGLPFSFTQTEADGLITRIGKTEDGEEVITEIINDKGELISSVQTSGDKIINQSRSSFAYNEAGLLMQRVDSVWSSNLSKFMVGSKINYEYDSKGRVIREKDSKKGTVDYVYDHNGNMSISCKIESNYYSSRYLIFEYEGDKAEEFEAFDASMYPTDNYPPESPVAKHGKLQVSGTNIIDVNGEMVVLRGMSTHDLLWFKDCYNSSSLDVLVDDWNINLFRLASYAEDQIKYNNGEDRKKFIDELVDECAQRGIYCMIDWHILNAGTNDPWYAMEEAKEFFDYMSKKHAGKAHVIYEICNEPNGSISWARVKSYAQEIVEVIRKNDPNSIIISGTPVWSQRVTAPAVSPLNYPNMMYALHFYADTHKQELRNAADFAIANGCPIFVTEFGTCNSSGNGGFNLAESLVWFEWMNKNNVSWANWNFGDKQETACVLQPGSCKAKTWDKLTESGVLIKCVLNDPTLASVDSCFNAGMGNDEEEEEEEIVKPEEGAVGYVNSLEGVSVAPNPVESDLTVRFEDDNYTVSVIDFTGNVIIRQDFAKGENTINVSNLQNGLYIVKVESDGKFYTEKIEKR